MSIRTRRMLRFALVGGTVAFAYVALYLAFLAAGLSQPLANGAAFLLAVLLQYAGQAAFTFGKRLIDGGQVLRFVVMIGLGFLTSMLITGTLGPYLALSPLIAAGMVAVLLPIQNFILMTLWVFASPLSQTEGLS